MAQQLPEGMDANNSSAMRPETSFGPAAAGRFDFTISFESAILSIVPSALFVIFAPQRLLWLMRQPQKVMRSSRPVLKLVRAWLNSSWISLILPI
jgi:hypothetical protein